MAYGDYGAGSSPRMRGAPYDGFDDLYHGGIIPAYAGSTIRAAATTLVG